jgi:hypothetical protein
MLSLPATFALLLTTLGTLASASPAPGSTTDMESSSSSVQRRQFEGDPCQCARNRILGGGLGCLELEDRPCTFCCTEGAASDLVGPTQCWRCVYLAEDDAPCRSTSGEAVRVLECTASG